MMSPKWTLDLLREFKEVFPKEAVQSADLETKKGVLHAGRTYSEPLYEGRKEWGDFEELREGQHGRRTGDGVVAYDEGKEVSRGQTLYNPC